MKIITPWLEQVVRAEWDTFLDHALSEAGLTSSKAYSRSNPGIRHYDDIALTMDGAVFTGEEYYCGEYTPHEFTIPAAFFVYPSIDRGEAEENIRAALRAERQEQVDAETRAAEAERRAAEVQAVKKRERDEAELERLAASLGKKIIDAD